jgi:3-phosphoshikimate 1-carboxyvinyltransferase
MLAPLACGESTVAGFLVSEDCLNTLAAMSSLGADVRRDGETVGIAGAGGCLEPPASALDLGNSGTGMRLLAGVLAGQPFTSELTGDASLRTRPMERIREPLELMGAGVELAGPGGCAPMTITGGGLSGIRYTLPVASAQVKSCVLLAGLQAEGETSVVEPRATRDHTERLLRAMGADIRVEGNTITVTGRPAADLALNGGEWRVPGDFSSAAFWVAAASMSEGSEIRIEGVGLNPRRTAFLDVVRRMGASVEIESDAGADVWEPAGAVTVRGGRLRGTEVGGDEIPNLIDELPLVAALGAVAEGETVIRDAAELRVKESDRIATMATGLRALGADVAESADGLRVEGGAAIRGGAAIESRGDHRIAMAMSILALRADGPVEVRDVACVATSYPRFWSDLQRVTGM